MRDVLFVLMTVAFFALAALFVRFCDSLLDEVADGDDESTSAEEPDPGAADDSLHSAGALGAES